MSHISTAVYDWWMERASKNQNSEAKIKDQVQGYFGLRFLNRKSVFSSRLVGSVSHISTAVYDSWIESIKKASTVRQK